MRTPVGVAIYRGRTIVVCSDGSVFRDAESSYGRFFWERMPPIPQSAAEVSELSEKRIEAAERQEEMRS